MARPRKYSEELRERAVRLYFESGGRPIAHVARDLGVHKEALRQWVRRRVYGVRKTWKQLKRRDIAVGRNRSPG